MPESNTLEDFPSKEEIQAVTIIKLCEKAISLGHDSVMWQHPLNKKVEDYCKMKGYTLNPLYGKNPPSKLGQQYIITFE